MDGKLGDHHGGDPRRESADARAGRIIGEELARLAWTEADLASRLRKETTATLKATAPRLHLGASKRANTRLRHWMQGEASPRRSEATA
jgi:hypothetical protein